MIQKTFFLSLLMMGISQGQITATEVVDLPSSSALGGGDLVGSNLIGRTYNAGQGPGIWIVADGGYRLYHNGSLLAQDNQAGRVQFVPMTFLPGQNALSVVGVNGEGAPGVLVQIDDLSGSYVSNSSWKVNTNVSDNSYKYNTYNDGSWSNASTSGNASALPSGASLSGFASGSTAQWIWSGNSADVSAVLRFTFDVKAEGFGAATTGGNNQNIVVATDWQTVASAMQGSTPTTILIPEGTYDFRDIRNAVTEANSKGRTWCKRQCGSSDVNSSNTHYRIAFEANSCSSLGDGSVPVGEGENLMAWSRWMTTGGNKTIIGMGRGANLRGASFAMRHNEGGENQIYRNLALYDVNPHLVEGGDGISASGNGSDRIAKLWVDHVSYKWISDGLDIENLTEGTISYLDFDGANEFNCWATDPYMHLAQDLEMTYANNYWHNTYGRVPKVGAKYTGSKVHIYNSFIDYNRYFILGTTGASSSINSQVLYENNYINNAQSRLSDKGTNTSILWKNNTVANSKAKHYVNGSAVSSAPADAVFTPSYSYNKRSVSALPTEIPKYAGVGGPWGSMPSYNQSFGQSNKAPSVNLTSPTGAESLKSPASLTLTANASDADGSIAKVDFYAGNTHLGSATGAPYSLQVSGLGAGRHSFVAVATDNSGLARGSEFVTVQVEVGNYAPVFVTGDSLSANENESVVGLIEVSDAENDVLNYSIGTGSDSEYFSIDQSGVLSFIAVPDFENPVDGGFNNIYWVYIVVSDGQNEVTQKTAIHLQDLVENAAPVFLTGDSLVALENQSIVSVIEGSDADGDPLTWAIGTGSDSEFFQIDANTGELSFIAAPDFENPVDGGFNNIYWVYLQLSDGNSVTEQKTAIHVEDLFEEEITKVGDLLQWSLENRGNLTVFNSKGQEVLQLKNHSAEDALLLNEKLGGLKSGTYYLKMGKQQKVFQIEK